VSIESAGDLYCSPPEIHIPYRLNVQNVGKSPATITNVFTEYRFPSGDVIKANPFEMRATIFPNGVEKPEMTDKLAVFTNRHSAQIVVCVHYIDLLTNEEHWVETRHALHAAKGPFYFNRDMRLAVDAWGFWERGEYRVDHD